MGDRFSTAVVFDACRFDIFQQQYEEYFTGQLYKARSPACHTYSWIRKTLTGYYPEIVVIAAHPVFNSKGVRVHQFRATDHFLPENIVDVWDFGYRDGLGTVDPEAVAEAVLERGGDEKLLIWFLQPHCPYIGRKRITRFYTHAKGNLDKDLQYWIKNKLEAGKLTPNELREAHIDNLLAAFKAVKKLRDVFSEKIIVTSDHGELLGEDGKFFHPSHEVENPILRTVPLFTGIIK